jgi:outer membrane protein TolC
MKTIKTLFYSAVVLFLPARLLALDLDGCVKMALSASHALKASDLNVEAARSAYARDRRTLLPALSVTGEDGYNHYQAGSGLRDGLMGNVGAQFSWDMGKTLSGYPEASRLELEKSRLLRDLAEKDIVRGVTQDYYSLYIRGLSHFLATT